MHVGDGAPVAGVLVVAKVLHTQGSTGYMADSFVESMVAAQGTNSKQGPMPMPASQRPQQNRKSIGAPTSTCLARR